MPRFNWPGQKVVPYLDKIADITESDTNRHYLDLAVALGETRKIISVQLYAVRVSGTGVFNAYPNEHASIAVDIYSYRYTWITIADGTNRLEYNQSVANDDWDLRCYSYLVESY